METLLRSIRDRLEKIGNLPSTPTGTAGLILDLVDEIDAELDAPTPTWYEREREVATGRCHVCGEGYGPRLRCDCEAEEAFDQDHYADWKREETALRAMEEDR